MGDKNILLGTIASGIPVHSDYATGDNIVPPVGATISDVPYAQKVHSHAVENSICSFFPSKPTASQVIMAFPVTSAMTLPIGATNSLIKSGAAATALSTFTIYKNTTNVGTFQFSVAATTATFTVASAVSYTVGDIFKIVAPGTPDTTLADLYIAIVVSGTI